MDSTTMPNILSGLECGVVVNLCGLYSGYVKVMSSVLVVLIVSGASCFFLASSSASCLSFSFSSRSSLHAVTCSTVMEWQPLQRDTKGSGLCRTADRADYMCDFAGFCQFYSSGSLDNCTLQKDKWLKHLFQSLDIVAQVVTIHLRPIQSSARNTG